MLRLYAYHPVDWHGQWDTQNFVVVAESERGALAAFQAKYPQTNKEWALRVFEIRDGMTIEADGYDRACLTVNGEQPPIANREA